MRSLRMGLRLCGMAEDPFWPLPNASSASRTSVRCRCRISVANFSMLEPVTAMALRKAAWRSRCTTWLLMGSRPMSSSSHTRSSTRGSMLLYAPDGAADLADGGHAGDEAQALEVAADLEGPHAELHAEGDGLGVDAVRAADLHGVAELEGAPLEHLPQRDEVALQQVPGALDLQRQPGVEHVAAGHAVVHVLAGVADVLGHVGEEGDHVVVGGRLDLLHAGHVERRLGDDLLDGLVRHLAEPVPGLHGGDLDVQPGLHLGLFGPDRTHLRERVALDHDVPSVVVTPPILSHALPAPTAPRRSRRRGTRPRPE